MAKNSFNHTVRLCIAALFMGINIILSSSIFCIPVPGGHIYLNDVIICLAALCLDPISAFAVGGVGSFLGDAIFYPTPMFVSLLTHGLQAVVISLSVKYLPFKKSIVSAIIGVISGAIIMVVGYTLGRAFFYGTPQLALIKLPYQILQATAGAIGGVFIYYGLKFKNIINKYI